MIRMFSNSYRRGDYLAGRMSLWGWCGLLTPCGVYPHGQAVTFGMEGSGKSSCGAIPGVIMHDGPVLAFDAKGEIAQRCYAARGTGGNGVRGRGDKTFVVDPTNLTGLPKSSYNPLHEIAREADPSNLQRLIYNLADGMIKSTEGENSWVGSGARSALMMYVSHVLTAYPHEKQTLHTVRQLLTEGDRDAVTELQQRGVKGAERMTPKEALLVLMQDTPPGDLRHVIAGQAAILENMGDRQRGAIMSALAEATQWLDLPQFQRATAHCDFFLSDFSTEKISLFVCLPLNELKGVAGGFMRMFLTLFTDIMYRAPHAPKAGTVLCLADEFGQFGTIERFCAIGPTMRDYGVKLWVLLQNLGQLKAAYPREWEGFLGSAAMVQYFAVKHGETLDYLVKSLGEKLISERDPLTGRVTRRPYPLLDRVQAARYLEVSTGNMIVVRGDHLPLRLKTTPYFWYLPYWRYSPDPRHPEPKLRAWLRKRAAESEERRAVGKRGVSHASANA